MSKIKTQEELHLHKDAALSQLDQYISSLIASTNPQRKGKADKLSYWLEDYSKFLSFEDDFSSSKLKKYKRGDILKVHLGYNVGSEEGGLHYAIVVEKDNSIHNPVITIVPLTSIKPNRDLTNLRNGEVLLGNELYVMLNQKYDSLFSQGKMENAELQKAWGELKKTVPLSTALLEEIESRIDKLKSEIALLQKMKSEINKMKKGSIALVNQITTISKIRIYDPKTTYDILSGIRLSNESLDKIDSEIIKKLTK